MRAAHPDLRFTMWYAGEDWGCEWGHNWGRIDPTGEDRDDVDEAEMRRPFPDDTSDDDEDDDPTWEPDPRDRFK